MSICKGTREDKHQCDNPTWEDKDLCLWHLLKHDERWREVYKLLKDAPPEEKTDIALRLIEDHPEHRLELPEREGIRANLSGVDLNMKNLESRASQKEDKESPWWDAIRKQVNLEKANLQGANLRGANLKGNWLPEANLQGADLKQANFQGAFLVGAEFQGTKLVMAILEEADLREVNFQGAILSMGRLQRANLREASLQNADLSFANLQDVDLRSADLQRANLVGVNLQDANLKGADLKGANLIYANLQGANLWRADFQGADLREVNFQGATLSYASLKGADLWQADLQGTSLGNAKLQGVDLSQALITNIYISGAWMDKTRLFRKQLGGSIGEELDNDYEAAKRGYLVLKQNFDDLGDYDASSWAYRKERRMEKLSALQTARSAITERKWISVMRGYFKFASDQFVEWLCDYGESIPRVLFWMGTSFLGFAFYYWSIRGVWLVDPVSGPQVTASRFLDYLIYSAGAFTTTGFEKFQAADDRVRLITSLQAVMGIFLAGLLGFVVGNRIRRS